MKPPVIPPGARALPHHPQARRAPWFALLAVCLALLTLAFSTPARAEPAKAAADRAYGHWVGRFGEDTSAWREIRLKDDLPPNRFEFRLWDGVEALRVSSSASMSLMARSLRVDLEATPVLCWRWRVASSIAAADMQRRQGDDYAARVYVSFKLPEAAMSLGLRARLKVARAVWGPDLPDAAVNYVWDNRHPVGMERANAYTDRAMMVVLRSGNDDAGKWVWERRNVKADVERLFGPGAQAVQLALTADTDNTGVAALAGFADFHFVPASSRCDAPTGPV